MTPQDSVSSCSLLLEPVDKPFALQATPRVTFGHGTVDTVAECVRELGTTAAVITGSHSLAASGVWERLDAAFSAEGVTIHHFPFSGEPSPAGIDQLRQELCGCGINVVVSIGGGSVLDCGKALAAMLGQDVHLPTQDFVEGVGKRLHPGSTLPHVAVPTTAGTGSESSANAVLSVIGPAGFKRSLRHPSFVPSRAIIDPQLHLSLPPDTSSFCALDALTQLLEAFVSPRSNPFVDTVCINGLGQCAQSLMAVSTTQGDNPDHRAAMAWAAYLSGIALTNAGLGVVHGLASLLGALVPIPHGVVCATLVAEATRLVITRLEHDAAPQAQRYRARYAEAGRILGLRERCSVGEGCALLIGTLDAWTQRLAIARLSAFGITESDLHTIAAQADPKNTPVPLSSAELFEMLLRRL